MAAPITMRLQGDAIQRLKAAAGDDLRNLRRQLKTAVRATARFTKSQMAKAVYDEINTTQKVIKKTIKDEAIASETKPRAIITMSPTSRIPVKDFKAYQTAGRKATKRGPARGGGVSYKIKRRGNRELLAGGFIVNRYGGNVFKRYTPTRATGKPLQGPSPWGVFVKNKKQKPIAEETQRRLIEEIEKRTRAIQGGWIRADNQRIKRNA